MKGKMGDKSSRYTKGVEVLGKILLGKNEVNRIYLKDWETLELIEVGQKIIELYKKLSVCYSRETNDCSAYLVYVNTYKLPYKGLGILVATNTIHSRHRYYLMKITNYDILYGNDIVIYVNVPIKITDSTIIKSLDDKLKSCNIEISTLDDLVFLVKMLRKTKKT